jgi:hypothetical protein
MFLEDKKRSTYSEGELATLERELEDYWQKSSQKESDAVVDLEKHLWLANGAAATASVGFLHATTVVSLWQVAGAWAFIVGIVLLVILKFVSEFQSSRMRYRFQDAKMRFDADQVSALAFKDLRDKTFEITRCGYLVLRWSAGIAFIAGLVFTLIGVSHTV